MLKTLTYRLLSIITILLVSSVAINAAEEIYIKKPKDIIEYFQSGEVEAVYSQFDTSMAKVLSPPRLAPIWKQLSSNYGKFLGYGKQDSASVDDNLITNTDLNFEKAIINFMLSFNKKTHKISGMYITEQEKIQIKDTIPIDLPSYIDTNSFKDTKIIIKDIYDLDGKLSLPNNYSKDIVFILVHGSGPQDMDGSFGKHKFLENLAWGLASKGFGVVRYNKLTLQHGSALVREKPKMTQDDEYNNSILGAIDFIKKNSQLKDKKIFLIGHSQGASAITSFSNNKDISGLILLSGSPQKLYDIYTNQLEYIFNLEDGVNKSESKIINEHKSKVDYFNKNKTRFIPKDSLPLELNYEYLVHLDKFSAIDNLKSSDIPVLIVNGGHDYQVTLRDFELWKKGLENKNNIKFELIENVNHIYGITDKMSVPTDYRIYRPISPELFEDLIKWINNL